MADELDEVVVTGTRRPTMSDQEIQDIIDQYNQGQGGVGGGGGGGGQATDPTDPPPTMEEILAAIRDFIASVSELDSVGSRDANSRFDRDPGNQTTSVLGDGTVIYQDSRTGSFWVDINGNGTVETEFWNFDGVIWYDIDNNGDPDTIVSGF